MEEILNKEIENTNLVNLTNLNSSPLKMSKEINELAQALSKAQSELESVDKSVQGYGYKYSDLGSVIKVAKPILGKNNLAISQLLGNDLQGHPQVTTILMHSSGQYITSIASMPLISMKNLNTAQISGAVYSYLRRYTYQGILGMSSEDVDASSEGNINPEESKEKVKQRFRRNVKKKSEGESNGEFEL